MICTVWSLGLWRPFIGEIGWGFTKSKLLLSHYQDTFCLFYYIGFFTDGTKQGRIKVLARKHESKQAQTVPVIIVLFTSTHKRKEYSDCCWWLANQRLILLKTRSCMWKANINCVMNIQKENSIKPKVACRAQGGT